MKTFKELYEACCAACEKRAEIEEVKEPTGDLKDACWKGYTAVGMKMKNGRKVPNCVPANEEVEQIDEGVVDSIKRATGFAMPSKHGDTVRGSVVAKYLEDNSFLSPSTLDKVEKNKYKLHHIDLETAKRHRDLTNKKVAFVGRDVIDSEKMDHIRKKHVTYDSLVKHPPVIHHDGTILDGNHRIQRAIELKHSKIPVLAPHDWKPRSVNEEVEQIDEISKDLASRYMRQIERQPGLDKDHPEKRKPNKFGSQKIGYERAFNKVSPFGKHRVKVQATEETTPGKNVVPPHVGALATGGIVKEEDGENKPLGKVMRAGDGKKKFKVYVKNAKGNVVKVGFGDPNMEIKRDDPERRKNFRARHNCDTATDRTTPRYWSCRNWRAGAKVEA